MKTNLNKELFTETGCIERRMLLNYRDGILKRSDMHLVEKHLVDCALCSEALEGLSSLHDDSVLNELSQHFNPHSGNSTTQTSPFRYLAMAASLAAVIALSYFAVQQSKNATVQEQALNTSPNQKDEKVSNAQPVAKLEPDTASFSNSPLSEVSKGVKNTVIESNDAVVAEKNNEERLEEIPAPSEELKDIIAAGSTDNEGYVFSKDENLNLSEKSESDNAFAVTIEPDQKTTQSGSNVSITKQSAGRGSRTPGASAPSAASNSNIANAEVAVTYDRSKSKKENTAADAYAQFKKGDYANALLSFETILNANPSDVDAMFHKGMCLYHLKRYDAALTNLTEVRKKGSKHSDEALFYIGQSYEQKGDNASAISVYKILVEGNGPFSSKASKRIKSLDVR